MRFLRLLLLLPLVALPACSAAWADSSPASSRAVLVQALCQAGTPVWVGKIVTATAGVPLDNTNTAVPFALGDSWVVMLQPDVAQFVQIGVAAGSQSDDKSVLYQANAMPCQGLPSGTTTLAADPKVTGATNLRVYRMTF